MRRMGLLTVALSVCLLFVVFGECGHHLLGRSQRGAITAPLPTGKRLSATPGRSRPRRGQTIPSSSCGITGATHKIRPTTVNIDTNVTVNTFIVTGYGEWSFTGSSTVNATNFIYAGYGWAPACSTTFTPVLNISGVFLGTWDQYQWYGPIASNSVGPADSNVDTFTTSTNGDTFGGGFNVSSVRVNINGNNNTINGGITVEGTKFPGPGIARRGASTTRGRVS